MNSQPAASARTELSLRGTRISPGLASGTVWVTGDILDCSAETHRIEPHQVDTEMERVRRAFVRVEAELEESARRVSEQIDPSLAEIFRAHRLMLESLLSSNEFEKELRGSLTSAAEAVKKVFRKWEAKFAAIQDETLHERADDILDLARRVLRQLEGADAFGLAAMPAGSVLVTQRLLPSDVVALSPRDVKAIVVELLGQGSHAALIIREKGIPTLAGLPGLLSQSRGGHRVLKSLCRLSIEPDTCVRRGEDTLARRGASALLIAKFLPGLNSIGQPLAGALGMPRQRFVIFDVLGAMLWVGLYVGLGYALHDQLAEAAVLAARLGAWAIAVVAGVFGFYLGVKVLRRQLFLRQLRIARISPEELAAKLTVREPVFIVDLRHELDVQAEPIGIPGAVHLAPAALEQGHAAIPRDREVVLYCS